MGPYGPIGYEYIHIYIYIYISYDLLCNNIDDKT
jgi:hypothetical protein